MEFTADHILVLMGGVRPTDPAKRYAMTDINDVDADHARELLQRIGVPDQEAAKRLIHALLTDERLRTAVKTKADSIHPDMTESVSIDDVCAVVCTTIGYAMGLPDQFPITFNLAEHVKNIQQRRESPVIS